MKWMKAETVSKQDRNDPKYRLLDMIEDFRKYSRTYIANNIPTVHRDMRIHLIDESYKLAESSVFAAYTVGNIRRKHLTDMCVRISLLNVLLGEIKDLEAVDARRLNVLFGKLSRIRDCVYGWKYNEEAKK